MQRVNTFIQIYQSPNLTAAVSPGKLSLEEQKYQSLLFTQFTELTVSKSWDDITQTAKLKIPYKLSSINGYIYDVNGPINPDINPDTGKPVDMISNSDYITNKLNPTNNTDKVYDKLYNNLFTSLISHKESIKLIDENGVETLQLLDTFINPKLGKIYETPIPGLKVNPLISVGDIILIRVGYVIDRTTIGPDGSTYSYTNTIGEPWYGNERPLKAIGRKITPTKVPDYRRLLFYGYVSKLKIDNDGNTEIECEDMMYYFKRAAIANKRYHSTDTVGATYHTKNKYLYGSDKGYSINAMLADMLLTPPLWKDENGKTLQGSTASGIQNINLLPRPLAVADSNNKVKPTNDVRSKYIFLPNFTDGENSGICLSKNIDTIIGNIETINATVYSFFEKLKQDWEISSFFRYDFNKDIYYLHVTSFRYNDLGKQGEKDIPNITSQIHSFYFGTDIIESKLDWKNCPNPDRTSCLIKLTAYGTKRPFLRKKTPVCHNQRNRSDPLQLLLHRAALVLLAETHKIYFAHAEIGINLADVTQ